MTLGVDAKGIKHAVGGLVRSLEEAPIETLAGAPPALADMPRLLLTSEGSVANKRSAGSTSPASVEAQLRKARAFLADRAEG